MSLIYWCIGWGKWLAQRGGWEISDFKWSGDEEISNFPPGCVSADPACSAVHKHLFQQRDQSSVSAAGHGGHTTVLFMCTNTHSNILRLWGGLQYLYSTQEEVICGLKKKKKRRHFQYEGVTMKNQTRWVCRIHYWNEHMYWLFFGQWLTDGHQTCNLERFAILFKFAIASKTFAQIFSVKNFFWPIPFGLLITACCDERLFKKKIRLIVQKSFSVYWES